MQRAKRFIVMPVRKENAKKDIVSMLKESGLNYQKVEEELIGNSPIIWITSADEKKIISFFKKKNMKAFLSDTSIVKLSDKPGEVAKIARILMSSGFEVKDAHLILKSKAIALYGILTNKPAEANRLIDKVVSALSVGDSDEPESAPME